MRVLFDIVHPAHVHFFKHVIRGLVAQGHETTIVAREKDVTLALLRHYGFEFSSVGRSGRKGRAAQLAELLRRDYVLWTAARRFRADIILTRNPAGVQAAYMSGATGIFDTDDGLAAGVHFRAAAPFADIITSPDCLPEDFGPRHVKYPGYKQTAYLHPDHFTPDPRVLERLRVRPGETFFLVRFVEMVASHDRGQAGFDLDTKREVIRRLKEHGRVFITSEAELPEEWKPLAACIPPESIHDALAFATLLVGDSQSMAGEAAVLGTPSIRVSTFAGAISYLEQLEHEYALTFGFHPRDVEQFFAKLDEMLATPDLKERMKSSHRRMLGDKVDTARWFIDYLETLPPGKPRARAGTDMRLSSGKRRP